MQNGSVRRNLCIAVPERNTLKLAFGIIPPHALAEFAMTILDRNQAPRTIMVQLPTPTVART
jgi:hypothetical protein